MTDGLVNGVVNSRIACMVLGAGQTGRGFIGRLLAEHGIPFLLVDKNEPLVANLQAQAGYLVRFFADTRPSMQITNFVAITSTSLPPDKIISSLKTIFVSVGPSNLASAAAYLVRLGARRIELASDRCDVITCENVSGASGVILGNSTGPAEPQNESVLHNAFRFMDAAVFCTTVQFSSNSLAIASEDYPHLECGVEAESRTFPRLPFLKQIADMESLMKRKLFTYNALSAIFAYLGWWKGYTFLSEAAADGEIQAVARRYLSEINAAIVSSMLVEAKDQEEFARRAMLKFGNPDIKDSIARNARDPIRKLSQGERVVGSLKLLRSRRRDCSPLADVAALMLLYSVREEHLERFSDAKAAATRLAEVSGLPLTDAFVSDVGQRCIALEHAGRGKLKTAL